MTAVLLTLPGLVLAGCEDTPAPVAAPVPVASEPPPAPHGGIVLSPQPDDQTQNGGQPAVTLVNDPSAPADTPLCGGAAREANGIGETLLPHQDAQAGICRSFACYDPATATYIGADGYRHVCR